MLPALVTLLIAAVAAVIGLLAIQEFNSSNPEL